MTTAVAAPSAYPAYIGAPSGDSDAADDASFRRCMRNTIYSFVLGRDPDVRSSREIEADYHASAYGR